MLVGEDVSYRAQLKIIIIQRTDVYLIGTIMIINYLSAHVSRWGGVSAAAAPDDGE